MEKEKTLSFRVEKELYEKIEYLEKNMFMSKSQICNLLIKQGLNYFSCQDEIISALEVISKISKVEKTEEKRILYLFLALSQVKDKIKLKDINFLAGTNISAEDFIKIVLYTIFLDFFSFKTTSKGFKSNPYFIVRKILKNLLILYSFIYKIQNLPSVVVIFLQKFQ